MRGRMRYRWLRELDLRVEIWYNVRVVSDHLRRFDDEKQ